MVPRLPFRDRLHATPDTSAAGASSPPPPIDDHRQRPAGVIPRRVQTWAVITVGLLMLLIMVTTRPTPPESAPGASGTRDADTEADQRAVQTAIEQYRRQIDEHQRLLAQRQQEPVDGTKPSDALDHRAATAPHRDALAEEQRRREYESLFADSVAHSVRGTGSHTASGSQATTGSHETSPSVTGTFDPNIAAAVALALQQHQTGQPAASPGQNTLLNTPAAPGATGPSATTGGSPSPSTDTMSVEPTTMPASTPPLRHSGPTRTLLEGTVIEAVLTNRLDGAATGPVNCMVTTPVYSHDTRTLLVPAGTRVLGRTNAVTNVGQERLALSFHRLIYPDGSSRTLDQFQGLDQIGAAGLTGQANHHYWSLFGAAAVVGLIQGLSLFTSTAALPGDSTVIITGTGESVANTAGRVMDRFLNRLPSITIAEGTRVKLLLTKDLELAPYTEAS